MVTMDVLVRDVPDEVVAAIDAKAKQLGISRTQFLRRLLAREAGAEERRVSRADLEWFSETFADLAEEEVMRGAWE